MTSSRYTTKRPKSWSSSDTVIEQRPTIDVVEEEVESEDTGLLNQFGVRLYRTPEKQPLGFYLGIDKEK